MEKKGSGPFSRKRVSSLFARKAREKGPDPFFQAHSPKEIDPMRNTSKHRRNRIRLQKIANKLNREAKQRKKAQRTSARAKAA